MTCLRVYQIIQSMDYFDEERVWTPFPLSKCLRTSKMHRLEDFPGRYPRITGSAIMLGPRHQFPLGSPAFPLLLFYEMTTGIFYIRIYCDWNYLRVTQKSRKSDIIEWHQYSSLWLRQTSHVAWLYAVRSFDALWYKLYRICCQKKVFLFRRFDIPCNIYSN